MDARRKRDQTVVDLNEFDANQTRALVTIESDLHTMATWMSDIEGLFTDGVTAIDFPMEKWMDLTAQSMLKTDLAQYTDTIDGIVGMTGENGQPATMLGADTDGGKAVMYPQEFGYDPGDLYGTGAYTLPGMASQGSPLRNAGVSGASVLGNRAVITSSGKSVSGKVTSAPATDVKKSEKKKKGNKVLGFLKGAADFIILDDLKTIADPNASLLNKGFAIFAVTPAGKGLKAARLGFKLVRKSPVAKVISSKKVNQVANNAKKKPKYVPNDTSGKKMGLPRNKDGRMENGTTHKPETMNPHTQIGTKKGRKGEYIQTLEWGNGKPVQRTDWTDHGRGTV